MTGLPAVGTRMEETATAPFTADDLVAYALVSGDDNPLHVDPALAVGAGFGAPPVHGMLILAVLEAAVQDWRPDLRLVQLSAKFVQPLLTGEAARLSGRVVRQETASVLMRLIAQGPARAPAVIAEARLVAVASVP